MSDIDNLINLPNMGLPTDSQRLAGWAVEALQERRFELAQEITRLAVRAAQFERDGLAGQPRRNRVASNVPRVAPLQRDGGHDAARPVPVAAIAESAVYGRPAGQHAAPEFHPVRCEAPIERDGVADVCHGVCTWTSFASDPDPAVKRHSGWTHLDPELEINHPAIVAPSGRLDGGK